MTTNTKMRPAAIVKGLQNYELGVLPVDAINGAREQWAECWPVFKSNMSEFSNNLASLSKAQDNLLYFSVLLAAQQREYEAYPLLLKIFDNNDDCYSDIERIFGDVITIQLPSIFYILSKDDYEQLNQLICSPSSGRFIKYGALLAITAKNESGQLARGKLVALVRHLLNLFTNLKTEADKLFLSTLSTLCIERDLHEFKQELCNLALSDKLELSWITHKEIVAWKPTGSNSLASGSVVDTINVVAELTDWPSFTNDYSASLESEMKRLEMNDPRDGEDYEWVSSLSGDKDGINRSSPYIAPQKIGRNDSCFCGSGKKYKKCCL